VLSRETGYSRDYGRNPYTGYDDVSRSPFLYDGPETPEALAAMARVVTVELNEEAVAYPYSLLQEVRAVNDVVGGVPIVVLWAPGTASALDAGSVAAGDDVGAATTFSREVDDRMLTFVVENDQIVDEQTGSEWNVLGRGVSGPLADRALEPVVSVNHFWFSWAAFKPETRIYRQDGSSSAPKEETAELSSVDLEADFEINLYQGKDILGRSSIRFSEVLARGQPVVLNLWAGLCPICRNELPELQVAHEAYGPGSRGRDGVLFIGVDVGPFVGLGSEEDGRALLDELGIMYPAGSTPDSAVLGDYDVLGMPTTHFILPSGESIERRTGTMSEEQLRQNVLELIERTEGL
jgi:thiol-disulfide isomerase/thioredoxin